MSAIDDDQDDYIRLCKKYSEKPQKLYGNHWQWLNAKHNNKTKLSFDNYNEKLIVEELKRNIKHMETKIEELHKKVGKLKNK